MDRPFPANARLDIPEVEWHRLTRFLPVYVDRAQDKRRQRERFYLVLYILILANTGIRIGEARRLRWRDVSTTRTLTDEIRAILSVRGKTGEREVVCNKGVERYLDELRSFRSEELGETPSDQEYVFCHRSGALVGSFKGGFQRALKEAGVLFASDGKKRVPYSLRHAYATMRISERVSVFQLAANMGTSVEMLEDFYGKKRMRDPKMAAPNWAVSRSPLCRKVLEFECIARTKKRAKALAIGIREDIIMLDKAPNGKVSDLLNALDRALSTGDVEHAVDLFQTDCYWRDLVTFTWNIKTMEGKEQVRDMLKARLSDTKPSNWKIADGEEASEAGGILESWIQFETEVARGFGHMRLKDGRIWTLLTTMSELKGYEEAAGFDRPMGAKHGTERNRKTWKEEREAEAAELGYSRQPYCVIVGGGQGGIALGARLRQLNVPTIIIEKNERSGDSWRKRYKSLCLHDPVWYDHLPYLPFPRNWPVFSPKDKIGDWLEMYTKVMELNYWGATECKKASYDQKSREWTVVVQRDGKEVVLKPKQLVLATGMSAKLNMPKFEGMDIFKGDQHHSSQHPGPDKYKDKKAVVIGSNNSAHDICAALWEAGADVTMVQRSTTHVVRSDSLMELGLASLYSEQAVQSGMTTAKADLIFASLPYKILHEFQIPIYNAIRERDADYYKRLEKAGFLLDYGDDDSGLFMKYLRRGSGYYIDVGASELVANGSIKLKSGVDVKKLTEHSVILTDGTGLPADLVVYATGYGSMNGFAADLISKEVANKVGKVWGLGSNTTKDPGPWEGEQRNMWKPTQQEALWFHGGNLHQSRHYSQFLSLQLKARMEGIPTPVYGLQKVHHLG